MDPIGWIEVQENFQDLVLVVTEPMIRQVHETIPMNRIRFCSDFEGKKFLYSYYNGTDIYVRTEGASNLWLYPARYRVHEPGGVFQAKTGKI